ncbi:hypothetical protein KZZ52_12845 [Dactylosporangium sp. AC04546]|uniref:hypothetical protein n=1 Tax=Dactylosporangium sp. AC04546 TaxID=2862460 RepID=UPI001EDE652F|nr:hypothetical protein [Dactylosporangium sp. AC04546]WVK86226.1 hypothetical protein KZZ52_12845 [Dactylosporangium sp. AC04546]
MNDFWPGIAPEHRAALAALLVAPLLAWQARRIVAGHAGLGQAWALRLRDGWRAADPLTRTAAALLGAVAALHLTMSPLLAAAALVEAWLALRAVRGRAWRRGLAITTPMVLIVYCGWAARGPVGPDQVGMAAAILQLTVLSLAARRFAARAATVLVVMLFGTAMWLVGFTRHDHQAPDRLQAGVVQRAAGPPPTAAQLAAARDLAEQTRAATAPYRELAAALAAGYRPAGPAEGPQVHFDHKGHQADGRTLDPQAPEQLVYAVRGDRALLLGVVYQVPVAGAPGPAIGGTSTRWHAHDVCVGLLPPGFGVVSPYGGCPPLTISVTAAEMMHVWVVDPPGGPYAEHLDDAWVEAKLAGER